MTKLGENESYRSPGPPYPPQNPGFRQENPQSSQRKSRKNQINIGNSCFFLICPYFVSDSHRADGTCGHMSSPPYCRTIWPRGAHFAVDGNHWVAYRVDPGSYRRWKNSSPPTRPSVEVGPAWPGISQSTSRDLLLLRTAYLDE